MIFGLADTDSKHDNVKKIVDLHQKGEELSQKLLSQFEATRKLETENDTLKKQLQEVDYSFAKGGQSMVGRPENFILETSSIEKRVDEDESNIQGDETMTQKVKRLESEVEEFQRIHEDMENSNRTLKQELQGVKAVAQSTMNAQNNNEAEIQEHLKHTRSILIKFLEKIPYTTKENEDLLPIIYSMMLFTKDEISSLQRNRQTFIEKSLKQQTKKGVFGMFGKKDGSK